MISREFFVILLLQSITLFGVQQASAQLEQQGSKLVATETVGPGMSSEPFQGYSVALSKDGNTAIVGAPQDNSGAGAAWVWTRSGGIWQQQAKLVGSGAAPGSSNFPGGQGTSVSLSYDGNTAIVGGIFDNNGTGAAWIFTRSGTAWTQQGGKLVGTGAPVPSGQGAAAALSGDGKTAIVGGPWNYTGGAGRQRAIGGAWIYTLSGSAWTQQGAMLVGSDAVGTAQQGASVALSSDGNSAIVGGFYDNQGIGAAWIYTRSGSTWTQQGGKLIGTAATAGAFQGTAVALSQDGNTAIVGGEGDNSGLGAFWAYTRNGGTWAQQGGKLVGTGAVGQSLQGSSIALSADGNTALVGAVNDNPSFSQAVGAAWVWKRSGGVWNQQGGKLVGTGSVGNVSEQGWSVGLSGDGNTGIVGGPNDNPSGLASVGAAWIYAQRPQVTKVTPNTGSNQGGTAVTVDGLYFMSGPSGTTFTFGSKSSGASACSSTTQCTTTSPYYGDTAVAATVDVQADINGPTSATNTNDHFTYTAGPNCTWSLSCPVKYAGYPTLKGVCTTTVAFTYNGAKTLGTSYSAPTGPTPGAVIKACDPTTGSCVSHSALQTQYAYCGKPPAASPSPTCTNLNAEIAATMKLINQYNTTLQSGGGANKGDIETGLTDANNQLAGLEQQAVDSGCVINSILNGPAKSP